MGVKALNEANEADPFSNLVATVPVGDKYAEYESDAGTIKRGDIVVVSDRDVPNDRLGDKHVQDRLYVGLVESICDMDSGGVEVFTSCGIGRYDVTDNQVGIRGEHIDTTGDMGADSFIESFLSRSGLSGSELDPVVAADVSELCVEWGSDGTVRKKWD